MNDRTTVTVEVADIQGYDFTNPDTFYRLSECPLAVAIKRTTGRRKVFVSNRGIEFGGEVRPVTPEIERFITAADGGHLAKMAHQIQLPRSQPFRAFTGAYYCPVCRDAGETTRVEYRWLRLDAGKAFSTGTLRTEYLACSDCVENGWDGRDG